MIRKFKIKNFKRFSTETVIELDPVTLMIGANNSGKSTVLQALSFFQYCLEVTRKKANGNGFVLGNKTIGPDEFGALPVASPTDLWPNGKTKNPIVLTAEFDNGATIGFEVKLAYNRFGIAPKTTGDHKVWIDQTKIRYVPIHTGIVLREEFRMAPAIADSLRGMEHGTVIRNLLWDLKEHHQERWKRLLDILKRMYPHSELDVAFDQEVDRFIGSAYSDQVLEKRLDLVVSGTGFQQVLQILTGVLSQGSSFVLLDEPDSHLHARLQVEMLRVFEGLSSQEGIQFLIATHSSHLVSSAPIGSLRAMIEGNSHRFATESDQMDLLDTLGAFDRMEILPLLKTKAVVFVENRDDRDYLEAFAQKLWGAEKARDVWEKVSFLFTYQEPMAAKAHLLARQIRDMLQSADLKSIASGAQPKFLVIGDRDYRQEATLKAEQKELLDKAASQDFKLTLDCFVWKRNEIENYLLDANAIEAAINANLRDPSDSVRVSSSLAGWLTAILETEKGRAQDQIAEKLQIADPTLRAQFVTTKGKAEDVIAADWGDGIALADAKRVMKALRAKLQQEKVLLTQALNERMVIEHMQAIPSDVKKALNSIFELSGAPARRRVLKVAKKVAKKAAKKAAPGKTTVRKVTRDR